MVPPALVYARTLGCHGHGYAVWQPESAVELGDVGSIERGTGKFVRMFNILKPHSDPLNDGGVPDGFRPLVLKAGPSVTLSYINKGIVSSQSVKREKIVPSASGGAGGFSVAAEYNFLCSEDSGELLLLLDDADRKCYITKKAFTGYIAEHYDSWCEFALAEGYDVDDPELEGPILVRGSVKTSRWGVAAWTETNRSQDLTIGGEAGGHFSAGISFSSFIGSSSNVQCRSGPKSPQQDTPIDSAAGAVQAEAPPLQYRDQCVFLSYFKVKKRLFLPRKIQAKAGDHWLGPPEDDSEDSSSDSLILQVDSDLVENPGMTEYRGLIDDALDYILEHSDADIAIACDGDADTIHNLSSDRSVERFPVEESHSRAGIKVGTFPEYEEDEPSLATEGTSIYNWKTPPYTRDVPDPSSKFHSPDTIGGVSEDRLNLPPPEQTLTRRNPQMLTSLLSPLGIHVVADNSTREPDSTVNLSDSLLCLLRTLAFVCALSSAELLSRFSTLRMLDIAPVDGLYPLWYHEMSSQEYKTWSQKCGTLDHFLRTDESLGWMSTTSGQMLSLQGREFRFQTVSSFERLQLNQLIHGLPFFVVDNLGGFITPYQHLTNHRGTSFTFCDHATPLSTESSTRHPLQLLEACLTATGSFARNYDETRPSINQWFPWSGTRHDFSIQRRTYLIQELLDALLADPQMWDIMLCALASESEALNPRIYRTNGSWGIPTGDNLGHPQIETLDEGTGDSPATIHSDQEHQTNQESTSQYLDSDESSSMIPWHHSLDVSPRRSQQERSHEDVP